MAIDFEKIRADNIREYGEGIRHLAFLGRLYPDQTHFIYELLQNAEDVKATSVKFSLHPDRLEFEHSGRLFNEADVRGICGVGEGTKTEDFTQIGKFGIGFKSVYAVTNCPEIHSGNDHFRLEHYVRPFECDVKSPAKGYTTLFIFPFDRKDFDAPMAFDELQASLKNMPTHTILFLKHIKEINIKINGDDCLTLSKKIAANHSNGTCEVVLNNGKHNKDRFLVFSKPVPNQDVALNVELAYQLSQKGTLIRPQSSDLIVYFPTHKQTNLGFLVQGPYRTTPARDNIPDRNEFNQYLISITADLMIESLLWMRDKGYIDENFYNLLPIDDTFFPTGSMFRPFYEKLLNGFQTLDLLMTSTIDSSRSFILSKCSNIAIAGSSEMRSLIDKTMLLELTKGDIGYWLNEAISERTHPNVYKYAREKLDIKEWRPEHLIMKLDAQFLAQRDDAWLIRLYKFILTQRTWFGYIRDQRSHPRDGFERWVPFLNKPIIRLQDGSHVTPYKKNASLEPSAYLAAKEGLDFPCVKDTILSDPDAKSFFENLGYTEPSEIEYVIEYVLPKLNCIDPDSFDAEIQIKTARTAIRAWSEANKQQKRIISDKLDGIAWLPVHSFADSSTYLLKIHKSCYYPNQDIDLYFEDSNEHFYLCPELMDEKEILLEMGLKTTIEVSYRAADRNGYVCIQASHGWHERGLNRFDPKARIDGLNRAIVKTMVDKNLERARFIWNSLLVPNKHLIKGRIEKASHQNYDNSSFRDEVSSIYNLVSIFPWIPDLKGDFQSASGHSLSALHEGLIPDKELAEALGITVDIDDPIDMLANELGIPKELIQEMKSNPELRPEYIEALRNVNVLAKSSEHKASSSKKQAPEFPKHTVNDPERRAQTVNDEMQEAIPKSYEKRERTVRTSGKASNKDAYLRHYYTNSNDEMVCQLCKKIMPFKKRNGEYYFEAVEMLTKELISKESESLYLALCPVCAAKYKEYIKQDNHKVQALIKQVRSSERDEIAIETDRAETLRFNPPHYLDIKTIVNELIEQE